MFYMENMHLAQRKNSVELDREGLALTYFCIDCVPSTAALIILFWTSMKCKTLSECQTLCFKTHSLLFLWHPAAQPSHVTLRSQHDAARRLASSMKDNPSLLWLEAFTGLYRLRWLFSLLLQFPYSEWKKQALSCTAVSNISPFQPPYLWLTELIAKRSLLFCLQLMKSLRSTITKG